VLTYVGFYAFIRVSEDVSLVYFTKISYETVFSTYEEDYSSTEPDIYSFSRLDFPPSFEEDSLYFYTIIFDGSPSLASCFFAAIFRNRIISNLNILFVSQKLFRYQVSLYTY